MGLTANAVPQSELDDAQAAADRAHATVVQARATLSVAEEDLHAAEARVSEARGHLTQSAPIETQSNAARANTALQRARVTGAEAAVALAQSQLDATRVLAPADGFSFLPSVNSSENFVKVVQRVPVKVRLATADAVLLPGLSAGVTVNLRRCGRPSAQPFSDRRYPTGSR